METRLKQLSQLHTFVEGVDKDLTMILQNLQWDRKRLLVSHNLPMGTCRYDNNHKLPLDKIESHETKCFMKLQRYSEDEELLPYPLDINANTLVTLSTQQIFAILNDASRCNPLMKRGNKRETRYLEPWSLERLQTTYTADERRAIHDAVVQAVPSCHDLADLALPSHNDEGASKVKSRVEILAELRNMKRRRTKYRMAAITRNYSDVLRNVIRTQMEFYSEVSQVTESSKTAARRSLHEENNNSAKIGKRWNRNDYCTSSSSTRDRNQQTFLRNKEVIGTKERPNEKTRDRHARSKYNKSPIREVRPSSFLNTAYNSKRTQSFELHTNERHKPNDNYPSSSHEKVKNRENYKYNPIREKNFVSESKGKHRSSDRRNEYGEYNSSDRSERKTRENQTQGNNRRKRNREFYTTDESEGSRTSEKVSRDRGKNRKRKRSREANEGQTQNYYNTCNSVNSSRMNIKLERLETSERDPRPRTNQTSSGFSVNKNSEPRSCIKQERIISPDVELQKVKDYSNTNSGSSALIKVEKAENSDFQYSYNRTESNSSDYTDDETRESNVRIKREAVETADKRTKDREAQSRCYNTSTYTDRHVKEGCRRNVYLERSSERQHGHRGSTNSNGQFDKNVNRDEDRTASYDRYGHRGDQRYRRRSSSSSSSGTSKHGHDSRRHEKYHVSRDTGRDKRERDDPSRRYYNKSNSNHDKKYSRSDVRDAQ